MATRKVTLEIPDIKNLNLSASKIMMAVIVVMAFVIGVLFQKVQSSQGSSTSIATTTPSPAAGGANSFAINLDTVKGLWSKDLLKFGDVNKKVLFVEIADPSCPYCHVAGGLDGAVNKAFNLALVTDGGSYTAPVGEMKKLVDSGKASFVYVYDPGHGNGQMGMEALYCANEKGKFWEVQDLLMSQAGYQIMNGYDASQQPTKGPVVKNDKAQSGAMATFLKSAIDPAFMKGCLDGGKYDSRLTSDQALAGSLWSAAGIPAAQQGTPTFFVNSATYPGAYSWDSMKPTVDAALK